MVRPGRGAETRLGLRRTVTLAAVVLAVLAACVCTSLVVLTKNLHDASGLLRDTVRSVRTARRTQVDLLLHERTRDTSERERIERQLRASLDASSAADASSPATRGLRDDARTHVERYLDLTRGKNDTPPSARTELGAALEALDQVVRANVEDADRTRAGTARLDELGDLIGVTSAVLIIAVPALLVWWIRGAVVEPMLGLARVMDRFGKGDLGAHAKPSGATELRRMTNQFNSMASALKRQHEARLTHLAGVAHDLRNPLAALQMSSRLIDPRTDSSEPAERRSLPSDENVRQSFAIVHRQVGRLTRMVDDLLDATRIEAGQLALKLEDKDLRVLVRNVVELFADTSEAHTISVELPSEPLVARCDPLRIEQTLTNLVSNAIKYSPRGGPIRITARQDRDVARVSVTDEGIGIEESELDSIWEPFRRTGVSSESIPGVGLGLWTAKRIIDAHGGSLAVTSTLAHGSTFTISLPLSARRAASAPSFGPLGAPVPGHG